LTEDLSVGYSNCATISFQCNAEEQAAIWGKVERGKLSTVRFETSYFWFLSSNTLGEGSIRDELG